MRRLVLLLLLSCPAAFGQVLNITAGQSTLYGGAGAGVTAYLPNSTVYMGAGFADGQFNFGLSDSFLYKGFTVTAGDKAFGYGDLSLSVRGLSVPKPQIFAYAFRSDSALHYPLLLATILAVFFAANLQDSRFGRAFNAVRQSAFAAQALGVPVARTKLLAFALAAAFAGLAGGLMAVTVGFIDPTEFGISVSLRQITFIVVGGLGSVTGSILGAVLLTGLPELLRGTQEYADLVYGAILLGSLLVMPRGLKGVLDWLWRLRPGRRPA